MTPTTSVTINLGAGADSRGGVRPLTGVAYWDTRRQTYAALLRLFDHDRPYPPSWARFGLRTGEFITPDALVNHLATVGSGLDDDSIAALQWLSHHVGRTEGRPELVGLVDPDGGRRLFLVTPSQLLLALNPRIDHHDYRIHWGDAGPATVETARLICEHVFVRRPSPDVETFALSFTYEFLSEVEGDFSVELNALCDWFLTDSELTTALDAAQLGALRASLGPSAA